MSKIFLSILGLALFTWMAKYFFILYYYSQRRAEINKLEARAAVLRMLLKAKLKRKGAQIQDQYKNDKEFISVLTPKLELLTTYNLQRPSDYTDILEILKDISEHLDVKLAKSNPEAYLAQKKSEDAQNQVSPDRVHATNSELWTQLLKYDKGNLYIIKEIVETTEELKVKVDAYNHEQENKELLIRAPEPIAIDGYEGLKNIVNQDLQHSKVEKEPAKPGSGNKAA